MLGFGNFATERALYAEIAAYKWDCRGGPLTIVIVPSLSSHTFAPLAMTNWRDPHQIAEDYASAVNLTQITGGIFILGVGYHSLLRLEVGMCGSSGMEDSHTRLPPHSIRGVMRAMFFFAYAAVALTSALIAFRIVAIWNRSLPVVFFVSAAVLVNAAFVLYGLIHAGGSVWNTELNGCQVLDSVRSRLDVIVTFVTDFLMLVVMIVGTWMKRGSGSLWRLVYRQGHVWLLIAVLSYVPLVVLISLNLNDSINMMLQLPLCVSMAVCAMRMHRGLYEYAHANQVIVNVSEAIEFSDPHPDWNTNTTSNAGPLVHITRMVETDAGSGYTKDGGPPGLSTV
ncbi:hypothetical protein A0H81_14030 [Grifola frondosa]|uniref:Uncharacterized protein n=1 Tax=Grifola frondosa TaxID=5627 RepID=A0A1C7LT66_GRIFR|nr:hypothetical protein A0H81_14030 [Grifola frondosa]